MKKIALLFAFFAIGLQALLAQTKEITGAVTSADDGSTIPGVSVSVKGTTLGTITDLDGKYIIKVPQNATTLLFSFVGMQTKELPIEGSVVNAVLESDVVGINEVVVTALGISREKKSLGYAVQEVDGDEVNKTKGDNFVSSLSGRVSGVQVKNSTNFGGSTNVVIRGSSSLTQNNQALFVVDGIPIDNSNTNNEGQLTGRSGYDYGSSSADINPNDIESISVLKGAAATALYGSRAANGVILITTKKGKAGAKGPQVKLSSNVTISKIDKKTFPEYQTSYGAGYGKYYYSAFDDNEDGIADDGSIYPGFEYYGDVNGDGTTDYTVPYYEDASRGQKFDKNILVYQWDALYPDSPNYMTATPWVAGAHGPKSFFETGVSSSNSIDVSGGDEKTTYRFSYTYFDQKGVMPNSHLDKNNVMFNGTHKILDNLKVTSSANYIRTYGKGRPSTGYSDNIMSSFRQWYQVNVDMKELEDLYKKTGKNITWNPNSYDDTTPAYWDNPYWVRYENYETDNRSRLIGYVQLDWDITTDLKAMGRYSIDTYNELQEERRAVGSVAGEFGVSRPDVTSGYSRYTKDFTETNLDFMLNYHKAITEDLDFSALLGTNIRRTKNETVYASTNNGLSIAGIYALKNSTDPMLPPEEDFYRVGVNGIFGSVS
jgi:TonB-linked SusC/RagA family outer membrane protein